MTETLFIYLSGGIKKGQREHASSFWGENEITTIRRELAPLEIYCLNPSSRADDLADNQSEFGRDMLQVFLSDFVLVDAREKRGVGVGAEMLFAKQQNIPVISIVPPNSHYHASTMHMLGQTIHNWTHPFVDKLSHYVTHDLTAAITYIKSQDLKNLKKTEIILDERSHFIFTAMQHYLKTQIARDLEMHHIIRHEALKRKLAAVQNIY